MVGLFLSFNVYWRKIGNKAQNHVGSPQEQINVQSISILSVIVDDVLLCVFFILLMHYSGVPSLSLSALSLSRSLSLGQRVTFKIFTARLGLSVRISQKHFNKKITFISLSLSPSFSLSLSLSLWLSLSVCLSLSFWLSLSVCLSLFLSHSL